MLNPIPVGSITLNEVDVNVSLMTLGTEAAEGEKVYATLADDSWKVYDQEDVLVTGVLSDIIVNFCKKTFHKDVIMEKELKLYFILQEKVND